MYFDMNLKKMVLSHFPFLFTTISALRSLPFYKHLILCVLCIRKNKCFYKSRLDLCEVAGLPEGCRV